MQGVKVTQIIVHSYIHINYIYGIYLSGGGYIYVCRGDRSSKPSVPQGQ